MTKSHDEVRLGELGRRLGLSGEISMGAVADFIGFTKRPIELSELSKAVDKYLKKNRKKQ